MNMMGGGQMNPMMMGGGQMNPMMMGGDQMNPMMMGGGQMNPMMIPPQKCKYRRYCRMEFNIRRKKRQKKNCCYN